MGIVVVATPAEAPEAQAWVFTDLDDPGRAWQQLSAAAGGVLVFTSDILGLETE